MAKTESSKQGLYAEYKKGLLRREEARKKRLHRLQDLAKQEALRLADILSSNFGARKVYLFGSLAEGDFIEGSDIDLAAQGIPDEKFYKAVGRLIGKSDFSVDLVDLEDVSAGMREYIEKRGVLLYDAASE